MSGSVQVRPGRAQNTGRRGPGRGHLWLVTEETCVRVAVAAAPSPHRPVRLTPLGRRLVAGLLLCAVLAAGGALTAPLASRALAGQVGEFTGRTTPVVVLPGDTLWGIARSAQPGEDPRDAVLRIQRLNRMSDARVFAGQRLVVPAGGQAGDAAADTLRRTDTP